MQPDLIEIDISGLMTPGQQALALAGVRPTTELFGDITRELTKEDIEASDKAAVGVSTVPAIKSIRETHHVIAQLIARGHKDIDVSRATGYSPSRISVLKRDPAMAELIQFYVGQVQDAFKDTVGKMKLITDDALDILGERLDADPDAFTNNTLLEIIKTTGDRAGYAPVQKSISVSATIDPSRLAALKARVKERENGEVRTVQVGLQSNQGTLDSTIDGSAITVREESETQR